MVVHQAVDVLQHLQVIDQLQQVSYVFVVVYVTYFSCGSPSSGRRTATPTGDRPAPASELCVCGGLCDLLFLW